MKKGLLSSFLVCLPTVFGISATPIQRYELEYLYITPAHTDKTYKSRLILKISTNVGSVKNKLIYFYVYNSSYPTGTMINNTRPKDSSGVCDILFTTYCFVKGKNEVHIFFFDEDGKKNEYLFNVSIDDRAPTVEVSSLKNQCYEMANIQGYTKSRGYFTATNRHDFQNWTKQYYLPIYNKFDITNLKYREMIGNYLVAAQYESIKLYIPTNYDIFADVTQEERKSSRLSLNLELVESGHYNYYLRFVSQLYVNPITHQMARSPRNGFVKTNYIYLPKDGYAKTNNLRFYIACEKIGTMRMKFNYNFVVQGSKSRIGDCIMSEYCVQAEETSYSDQGKEIVHG